MRPSVDDELVEELNERTNSEFRVPADRLGFNDRLRALFDQLDELEQTNENLRERLRSGLGVTQSSTEIDSIGDDRDGDKPSFL
jgi:hypothetical protein